MSDIVSNFPERYSRQETFDLTKKGLRIEDLDVLNPADREYVTSRVRTIPGWPEESIHFRDFIPVLQDAKSLKLMIDAFEKSLPVPADSFDYVGGLEARGFLMGVPLAMRLGKGFLPFRKAGKLPPRTIKQEYTLEYGKAAIEIEEDELKPGSRVLIVDDLIATGGTATAAAKLVEKAGGKIAGFSFFMMLDGMNGRDLLKDYPTSVLIGMPA